MPERIYGGSEPSFEFVRENYNEVFREIYRKIKGLGSSSEIDFGYANYLNGDLSESEKHDFDEALSNAISNFLNEETRDTLPRPLRAALSNILNSAAIEDEDKFTDLDTFYALGLKTGDASTYSSLSPRSSTSSPREESLGTEAAEEVSDEEMLAKYDEVFKEVGHLNGQDDFSYEKYQALSPELKRNIEIALAREIAKFRNTGTTVLPALKDILTAYPEANSLEGFLSFTSRAPRTESEGALEGEAETEEEEAITPSAGEAEASEEISEGSATRVFAGYDKKLTFFKAIKKAYKDRKEATGSKLLGTVSGIRAAFCKAKWPLTIAGLVAIGVPAGALLAAGATLPVGLTLVHLPALVSGATTLFVGANFVGLALQKLEDGKINHGMIGGIKNFFTKGKDEEVERDFPTPTRSATAMPTPSLGDEARTDVAAPTPASPDLEETATITPPSGAPAPIASPEVAPSVAPEVASNPEVKSENIFDLMEKYDSLKHKIALIDEARVRGFDDPTVDYHNMKLDLAELGDKIRRYRSLSTNIEDLEMELEKESGAYKFWEKENRRSAAEDALARIREINEKINSLKNTTSLAQITDEWMKDFEDAGVGINPEREKIMETLYRNSNSDLFEMINMAIQEASYDFDFEPMEYLQGIVATPTAIRLQDLEIGQDLATKKGRYPLASQFGEEIDTLKPNSKELSEEELAAYVNARLRNLQAAKKKVEKLSESGISIGMSEERANDYLNGEIGLLQKRYQSVLYRQSIKNANWGTNSEDLEREESRTR